jgi:hypothetical protein
VGQLAFSDERIVKWCRILKEVYELEGAGGLWSSNGEILPGLAKVDVSGLDHPLGVLSGLDVHPSLRG